MHSSRVPEGPNAGKPVLLAPFQRRFIEGAVAPETATAVLSIGRGNGKSAITAGLALGGLIGVWDRQPRREIIAAARNPDHGKTIWEFVCGLITSRPLEHNVDLSSAARPVWKLSLIATVAVMSSV